MALKESPGDFLWIAALLLFCHGTRAAFLNPNPQCSNAFGDRSYRCSSTEWLQCVSSNDLCDGVFDCLDDTDEFECEEDIGAAAFNESCQQLSSDHTVKCFSNAQCINEANVCDGNKDCIDGSDETSCDGTATPGEVCPGLYDAVCVSFFGLSNPYKCPGELICLTASNLCDGSSECADNSDEEKCCGSSKVASSHDNSTAEEPAFESASCQLAFPEKTFQCSLNTSYIQCVSADEICNAVKECADGSDELNCTLGSAKSDDTCKNASSDFPVQCFSGSHCISEDHLCDGIEHCVDGSDEYECVQTTPSKTTTEIPTTGALTQTTTTLVPSTLETTRPTTLSETTRETTISADTTTVPPSTDVDTSTAETTADPATHLSTNTDQSSITDQSSTHVGTTKAHTTWEKLTTISHNTSPETISSSSEEITTAEVFSTDISTENKPATESTFTRVTTTHTSAQGTTTKEFSTSKPTTESINTRDKLTTTESITTTLEEITSTELLTTHSHTTEAKIPTTTTTSKILATTKLFTTHKPMEQTSLTETTTVQPITTTTSTTTGFFSTNIDTTKAKATTKESTSADTTTYRPTTMINLQETTNNFVSTRTNRPTTSLIETTSKQSTLPHQTTPKEPLITDSPTSTVCVTINKATSAKYTNSRSEPTTTKETSFKDTTTAEMLSAGTTTAGSKSTESTTARTTLVSEKATTISTSLQTTTILKTTLPKTSLILGSTEKTKRLETMSKSPASSSGLAVRIQETYNYGGWTNGMCFKAVLGEELDVDSVTFLWEINNKHSTEMNYCTSLAPTENIIVKLTVEKNSTIAYAEKSFSNNGWELIIVVTVIPITFTVALSTGLIVKHFKFRTNKVSPSPLDGI